MMMEERSEAAAISDALMQLTQTIQVQRMVLERRAEELEKQVSRIELIRRRIQSEDPAAASAAASCSPTVRRAEEGGLSIDRILSRARSAVTDDDDGREKTGTETKTKIKTKTRKEKSRIEKKGGKARRTWKIILSSTLLWPWVGRHRVTASTTTAT